MRAVVALAVTLACIAVTTSVSAQQQVRLTASIIDGEGQVPDGLSPDDLIVMEDGEAAKVVSIDLVRRDLKVEILVDNGLGLGQDGLLHLRNGVAGLIKALPEDLEVALVTTAPQPRFLARSTANRETLLQAAGRLTPDSSPGRFVEALSEALQRVERDRNENMYVLIMAATTAGDRDTRSSDVQDILQRARLGRATLHVALLESGALSSSLGVAQTEIGQAVSAMTGGRYETINAPQRLATLLPELGAYLAEARQGLGSQFRITVERPAGRRGDLGSLTMRARGGYNVLSVSVD